MQTQSKMSDLYNINNDKKITKLAVITLLVTTFIVLIGCILLYSAAGSNIHPWCLKQFITFIIFVSVALIINNIHIKFIYKQSYNIYIVCLLLLLLTELFGHSAMGAQRWVHIGNINLQPSELMKVAIILALSRYFHQLSYYDIPKISAILPPLIILMLPTALILKQPNLGTSMIIILITGCILFAVGVRLWKFITVLSIAILSLPLFWIYLLHDYQKKRVLTFLNPETDILGSGYNVMQSKIAIGSGKIYGKGLFSGSQSQLNFLPEKHTDFIFSILSEELGFLGVILMLTLYMVLISLCYIAALRSNNHYGRLISVGVGSMIFTHVLINLAMISGMIPIVGTPMPLLSYGGSNLSACLICIGLVMNVITYSKVIIRK